MKRQDRPSQLGLLCEHDNNELFRLYAPIQNEAVVWHVHLIPGDQPDVIAKYSDEEDVLALIDGIFRQAISQNSSLSNLNLRLLTMDVLVQDWNCEYLASWRLAPGKGPDFDHSPDGADFRLKVVQGAMRSLRTK